MSRTAGDVGTLTGDLKDIICTFFDCDLQIMRETADSVYIKRKMNDELVAVLRKATQFFMFSDYFSAETKYYLCHHSQTYSESAEDLGRNKNTVKSKTWYDMTKLQKSISRDTIRLLLADGDNKANIKNFDDKLTELMTASEKRTIADNLVIKLPRFKSTRVKISKKDWYTMLKVLVPYAEASVRAAKAALTDDMLSYFWYLAEYGKYAENAEDKARLIELEAALNGDFGEMLEVLDEESLRDDESEKILDGVFDGDEEEAEEQEEMDDNSEDVEDEEAFEDTESGASEHGEQKEGTQDNQEWLSVDDVIETIRGTQHSMFEVVPGETGKLQSGGMVFESLDKNKGNKESGTDTGFNFNFTIGGARRGGSNKGDTVKGGQFGN